MLDSPSPLERPQTSTVQRTGRTKFTCNLPASMLDCLKAEAARRETTISSLVESALRAHLDAAVQSPSSQREPTDRRTGSPI